MRIVFLGGEEHAYPMTTPALPQEIAAPVRRTRGERRPSTVRAEPDDTLLAAWQETEPKLRRLAVAMGVGRTQVEDVLQDVYMAAHRSAPTRDEESCRRWLFRVTVNRCRLEHRRRKRWQTAWEKLTLAWEGWFGTGAVDAVAQREEQAALRRALRQLPPELRNPVVLRYYCDLNSTEIGEVLDLPAATVRGQLSTARKRLAEALRNAGFRLEEKSE